MTNKQVMLRDVSFPTIRFSTLHQTGQVLDITRHKVWLESGFKQNCLYLKHKNFLLKVSAVTYWACSNCSSNSRFRCFASFRAVLSSSTSASRLCSFCSSILLREPVHNIHCNNHQNYPFMRTNCQIYDTSTAYF